MIENTRFRPRFYFHLHSLVDYYSPNLSFKMGSRRKSVLEGKFLIFFSLVLFFVIPYFLRCWCHQIWLQQMCFLLFSVFTLTSCSIDVLYCFPNELVKEHFWYKLSVGFLNFFDKTFSVCLLIAVKPPSRSGLRITLNVICVSIQIYSNKFQRKKALAFLSARRGHYYCY